MRCLKRSQGTWTTQPSLLRPAARHCEAGGAETPCFFFLAASKGGHGPNKTKQKRPQNELSKNLRRDKKQRKRVEKPRVAAAHPRTSHRSAAPQAYGRPEVETKKPLPPEHFRSRAVQRLPLSWGKLSWKRLFFLLICIRLYRSCV